MKPNEVKLIEEKYHEKMLLNLKSQLNKLVDNDEYLNYDEQEVGFQNGWNDAINHIIDNILKK